MRGSDGGRSVCLSVSRVSGVGRIGEVEAGARVGTATRMYMVKWTGWYDPDVIFQSLHPAPPYVFTSLKTEALGNSWDFTVSQERRCVPRAPPWGQEPRGPGRRCK